MEVRIYPRIRWLDSPDLRRAFVPTKLTTKAMQQIDTFYDRKLIISRNPDYRWWTFWRQKNILNIEYQFKTSKIKKDNEKLIKDFENLLTRTGQIFNRDEYSKIKITTLYSYLNNELDIKFKDNVFKNQNEFLTCNLEQEDIDRLSPFYDMQIFKNDKWRSII